MSILDREEYREHTGQGDRGREDRGESAGRTDERGVSREDRVTPP